MPDTPPTSAATIRFVSTCPPRCRAIDEHFHSDSFREWFGGLTESQREWLRDKARWEHMTLSAVAKEWGVPTDA